MNETIATDVTPAAWVDQVLETYFRFRPVEATLVGRHEADRRLPTFSREETDRYLGLLQDLLERRPDPAEPITDPAVAMDLQLACGFIEMELARATTPQSWDRNPTIASGQALFAILSLLRRPYAPAQERLDAVVARLEVMPELLDVATSRLHEMPKPWIDRARSDAHGLRLLLTDGLARFAVDHEASLHEAGDAIDRALEALDRFVAFLEAAEAVADGSVPGCGQAVIELILDRAHALGGVDAVERAAFDELEVRRRQLEQEASQLGFATSGDALATLGHTHPSRQTLVERHVELFDAHRSVATEQGLVTWPDYPLHFVEPPAWLRPTMDHAVVYPYHAPAPDDEQVPVEFLVPTPNENATPEEVQGFLAAANDTVIKLNHIVHHGGIGHHVQNWYAYNRSRSAVGRIAAVDSAGHILMLCGMTMAEGWASYVPGLMAEAGFLTDVERLVLHADTHRAATRAIVDVKLHSGRWTAEDAIGFLVAETGTSTEAAQAAVTRLSLYPGTGSTYLMGPMSIRRIRGELCDGSSDGWSVQEFHDELLSWGSVPVELVARYLSDGVRIG